MPVAPSPTATSTTISATRVIRSGTRGARSGRAGVAGPLSMVPALATSSTASAAGAERSSAVVAMVTSSARSGSTREPQGVAHPTDRVQQPRVGGVDLAAQVGDVGLDDVGLAVEVVVPHVVQDLRLRQHPPGVGHQVAQQLELGGGQGDDLAGLDDL